MFCKYRNIFGKPGEGFHSIRVLDVAILDVIGTLLVAIVVSKAFGVNFLLTTATMFVLAILVHRMFCVNTKINKMMFGEV